MTWSMGAVGNTMSSLREHQFMLTRMVSNLRRGPASERTNLRSTKVITNLPTTNTPPPLRDIPTLEGDELVRARSWFEDKAVRMARERGYCSEVTSALDDIFGGPIDGETYRDSDGADCWGNRWRDSDGFDRNGLSYDGRDRDGYDKDGRDVAGFDRDGKDKDGVSKDDPARFKYDRRGYDPEGFNRRGVNAHGLTREQAADATRYEYDPDGYRLDGFNAEGYTRDGNYDRTKTHSRVTRTR